MHLKMPFAKWRPFCPGREELISNGMCLLLCHRFSGIKKETLQNVFTRLSDVQKALKDLLPEDAILCGQSLDGDLRALQVMMGVEN